MAGKREVGGQLTVRGNNVQQESMRRVADGVHLLLLPTIEEEWKGGKLGHLAWRNSVGWRVETVIRMGENRTDGWPNRQSW